jgi:hypothetical protein
MSILGSNGDFVFFEGFLIKPHEAGFVHVLEEHDIVFVGDIFSLGVVFAVHAKLRWIAALMFVGAEIHAYLRREFVFVREGFAHRCSFFDMEQAHFQALLIVLLFLFLFGRGIVAVCFAFGIGTAVFSSRFTVGSRVCFRSGSCLPDRCRGWEQKRLLQKWGSLLGGSFC